MNFILRSILHDKVKNAFSLFAPTIAFIVMMFGNLSWLSWKILLRLALSTSQRGKNFAFHWIYHIHISCIQKDLTNPISQNLYQAGYQRAARLNFEKFIRRRLHASSITTFSILPSDFSALSHPCSARVSRSLICWARSLLSTVTDSIPPSHLYLSFSRPRIAYLHTHRVGSIYVICAGGSALKLLISNVWSKILGPMRSNKMSMALIESIFQYAVDGAVELGWINHSQKRRKE